MTQLLTQGYVDSADAVTARDGATRLWLIVKPRQRSYEFRAEGKRVHLGNANTAGRARGKHKPLTLAQARTKAERLERAAQTRAARRAETAQLLVEKQQHAERLEGYRGDVNRALAQTAHVDDPMQRYARVHAALAALWDGHEDAAELLATVMPAADLVPHDALRGAAVVDSEAPAPAAATFEAIMQQWVAAVAVEQKSDRHARASQSRFRRYAAPLLAMPIADISTADIVGVLQPLHEQGKRVAVSLQSDLSQLFKFAMHHDTDFGIRRNPATAEMLKRRGLKRLPKLQPRAAVPVDDAPTTYRGITGSSDAADALRLAMLTGVRACEAARADASEFDAAQRVWVVPAERMKTGRPHDVPLSDAALAVVTPRLGGGALFPSLVNQRTPQRPMLQALRVVAPNATVHGLRSSLRDWCGRTGVDRELAELVLAHSFGSSTEQSYRRENYIERRRAVLSNWAAFLVGTD